MALTQISTNGVKDGSLKNADVASDAAIALSKLATGALPSGLTVASANITDGTIVNADINSSAAIALSKISISGTGSSSNYLRGDGSWQAVPAGGIGSESSSKRYVIAGPQAGEDIGGDGDDNTLIGYQAGKEINGTYGKKVTAIGSYACRDQTSGQGVVAVGYKALASNTTNEGNTVVGYEAQTTSTSAHSCTSIGRQAHYSLQSGDYNTAIGNQAIYNLTTGTECTAVGDATGKLWGSGSFRNTAIGRNAFSSGSAGTVNYGTAVGWEALYKNNSGEGNTAVGSRALYDVTDGTYNVGVGRDSGENISSGDYNVCIGYEAGDNLTTANNNICIGYGADPENATDDNRVTIGNSNITSFEVPGCNFKVVTSTATNDYILKIGAGNAARWEQDLGAIAHGWGNHGSQGYITSIPTQSQYLRSDTADTAQGDITFAGGAGAITLSSSDGSDIRFQNSGGGSTATGMASLRLKDHFFLIQGGESGIRFVTEDGTARWQMNDAGKIQPLADATYDIGADGARVGTIWANNLRGDGANITNVAAPSYNSSGLTIDTSGTSSTPTQNLKAPNNNRLLIWRNRDGGDGSWYTSGASNEINLQWNSYSVGEILYLRNNGQVGIGTSDPNSTEIDANARCLHIYKNATNGALLKCQSSNTTFQAGAFNDKAIIRTHTQDPLEFGTDGTKRMELVSTNTAGRSFLKANHTGSSSHITDAFFVRCWMQMNGHGTISVTSHGYVSSVSDHGTGEYTMNITSNMADDNYAFLGCAMEDHAGISYRGEMVVNPNRAEGAVWTNGVRFSSCNSSSGNRTDCREIYVAIVR